MEPEPMPDPSSEGFLPEQSLAPLQSEDLEARQERLQREIEKAGQQAKQLAYAQLRDQVRIERGRRASQAGAAATVWLWCFCRSVLC